ncbi:hypothetical protein J7E43_01735 [Bacillus sp. ISL-8]|uniref:Uncharacterized protein n=1 Tax=Bacillus cereus TaxID=1396 RepID=A0A1S9TIL7_BACCE|nr:MULTISPECIES: hypothetical protein [Bacillus cereus group]MBT2576172.1 hypothetical protein [Bacillus sp. ISL-8]ETT80271.1 IS231-related transposase [Bacillus mycoides FSL H7-687]OOR09589.1 hypothetical protein BW897_26745 [Bacillus cereus]PGA07260.1 hypothetical protein COL71_22730 [Bacillus mycoides]QWG75785.1 hypothetical protein EXW63_27470 [Bacillus mycoides]
MDGLISSFQSGQTCKISNAYVGMTDKRTTAITRSNCKGKKNEIKYSARSSDLAILMRNTNHLLVLIGEVNDWYSLR